jgi:translation initiation factor 4G
MSNMFGILNEAGDGSAAEASTDSAPERKKLQLAPRTKPIPAAEDGEGEHEGSDDGEQAEGEGEGSSMTEEEVKAKIAMDVKELWGEKDAGGSRNPADIVEYYTALPAEFRYLLSERLGEDAFRIAKIRDAEVVAKGWKAALAAEVATAEDLKKG